MGFLKSFRHTDPETFLLYILFSRCHIWGFEKVLSAEPAFVSFFYCQNVLFFRLGLIVRFAYLSFIFSF